MRTSDASTPRAFTLDLSDPRADLARAGGKGSSLSRLAREGYPVPAGFHVTTEAYRAFVAANGLEAVIAAELARVDADRPEELEAAASRVRAAFLSHPLPASVETAVRGAWEALARAEGVDPGRGPAVAVRSSATAEDLPGLSFAGQQESFLDVRGLDAVMDALRRCWASLWNGRAVAYRLRRGYEGEGLALAVVVQLLVDADAAGVLFTADPVSGRRGVALIDAAFGLGESVVGGLVAPDVLVVDKGTGRVLGRTTADKALRTVRLPGGGTAEEALPEALRRAETLSDAEAASLVATASRIEASYGLPMDIEWARAGGSFFILQARPITALPEEEGEPPRDWPLPREGDMIGRGSIVDFAPEPLSTLFSDLGMRIYEEEFRAFLGRLTGRPRAMEGIRYTAQVNGYLFVNMRFPPRYFLAVLGSLPAILRRMRHGARILEEERGEYEAAAEAHLSFDRGRADARSLLAEAERLWRAAARFLLCFQTGPAGAGAYEMALTKLYDRHVRRPGEAPASALLLGFESAATRAEDSLHDLSLRARAEPALAAWFLARPLGALVADLAPGAPAPADLASAGVPAGAWAGFAADFHAHVARHCRSIFDLDFSKPCPSEGYEPLLLALRSWMEGRGTEPRKRREAAARRREELAAASLARLRGFRAWMFRLALRWASRGTPLREEGIASLGIAYPALRATLLALGARLAARGVLPSAEAVFWLREGELRAAAAAIDAGGTPASLASSVAERRAEAKARARVRPPSMIPKKEKVFGFKVTDFMPSEGNEGPGRLRGVAASSGRVTAPARVLRGSGDFALMRPGEVLVAEITTPAWTPLFSMAAAVVTDVGGPLSHGSIVAREYGIPAVLGTGEATRRVRNGDALTVDGDAGTVTWEEAAP